jgi:hypothetical protein
MHWAAVLLTSQHLGVTPLSLRNRFRLDSKWAQAGKGGSRQGQGASRSVFLTSADASLVLLGTWACLGTTVSLNRAADVWCPLEHCCTTAWLIGSRGGIS